MSSVRFALHSASAATMHALGSGAVAPYGQPYGPSAYGSTYAALPADRPLGEADEGDGAPGKASHRSALRSKRAPRYRTR